MILSSYDLLELFGRGYAGLERKSERCVQVKMEALGLQLPFYLGERVEKTEMENQQMNPAEHNSHTIATQTQVLKSRLHYLDHRVNFETRLLLLEVSLPSPLSWRPKQSPMSNEHTHHQRAASDAS